MAHKGINEALFAVQKEGIKLQKNAINPHFKNTYITLDAVLDKVLPVFQDNGLLLVQAPDNVGPVPALTTKLIHVPSGQFMDFSCPMILDKDTPQGVGSAITYYRRYGVLSILGLVADEDDDGEGAVNTGTPTATKETLGASKVF